MIPETGDGVETSDAVKHPAEPASHQIAESEPGSVERTGSEPAASNYNPLGMKSKSDIINKDNVDISTNLKKCPHNINH